MNRVVIGLALVLVGLFWPQIQERIPDLLPKPTPAYVVVEPESEEIKEKVSSIATLVTDDNDRLLLAVFNQTFAERVENYDADAQDLTDVYVEAARNVFGESMRGKYDGYSEGLTSLMKNVLGNENHQVTKEEKAQLSAIFSGLAWALINE
jgi:hypothetical protein